MDLYTFDDFDLGECLLQMSKAPEWVLQDDLGWTLCSICFYQQVVGYPCLHLFSVLTWDSMHRAQ